VGDILNHLCRVHEEDPETVAAHNDFANWIDELDRRPEPPASAWRNILWQLTSNRRIAVGLVEAIAASLEESPYLPRAALAYLCRDLSQRDAEMRSAELLVKCRSESVSDYIARAWRERVKAGWDDELTTKLEGYLLGEPRALDAVRERLADTNASVRLAATRLLGQAGTLDDVTLLSDLVSLPPMANEDSRERGGLLDAMWTIAHRD
jgi:hypothetical protein